MPLNPTELGRYNTGGVTYGVDVEGNYALLADHTNGMRVIDVADSTAPAEIGYFDTGGDAMGVTVNGSQVFVADEMNGVYILRFDETTEVLITGFDAVALDGVVRLSWRITADESIDGLKILRETLNGGHAVVIPAEGLLPSHATAHKDTDINPGETYYYRLIVVKSDGSEVVSHKLQVRTKAGRLVLNQNFPNPFNPSTTISFTLPARSHVNLSIYNIEGKLVETITNGILDEGFKEYLWNGTDSEGAALSSGVYFYRLHAGKKTITKKMVLLK
jgi:hypothetical protein